MKTAQRRSIAGFVFSIFLAGALLLIFGASDSAQGTANFNPTASQRICNDLSKTFPDSQLVGQRTSGTAESGTATTLTDTAPIANKFAPAGFMVDAVITITAGPGAPQSRTITANTVDTVTAAFSPAVGTGSQYRIECANPLGAGRGDTSVARTLTTRLNLADTDLQSSDLIIYEPNGVSHTPGCNVDKFDAGDTPDGVLDGRDYDGDGVGDGFTCLRPGDKVGGMRNLVSLGILNSPCNQLNDIVDFYLYNVALPDDVNNPRNSTNIYTPKNEGEGDRIETGAYDDNPEDGRADFDSPAIQDYPDWLLDLFDPDWLPVDPPVNGPKDGVSGTPGSDDRQNSVDGPKKPIIPIAVYGAITKIAGTWNPLYFVQFDSGQLADVSTGFAAPHPYSKAVAALGKPSITVLTDTTTVIASVTNISDFCSALISDTMLLGTTLTDSRVRATNPATAGSHAALAWTMSQRDLDNDGFENQIDTCPAMANIDTDPRDFAGDPDGDMIDGACDPEPSLAGCGTGYPNNMGGDDCDNDDPTPPPPPEGTNDFLNAEDNCPLVANIDQTESEDLQAYGTAAADGGPKTDGMGDACDSGSWSGTQNGVATTVTLSTTVSNGKYHLIGRVMPTCYGAAKTDADGDGWCSTETGESDASALLHPKLGDWSPGADYDGDGANSFVESFIGSEDAMDCNQTGGSPGQNDEPLDGWFTDFNDDKATDIYDVNMLKPAFFKDATMGSPPYLVRVDLNADGRVDIYDVNVLKPNFFLTCTSTPQQ